MPIPVMVWWWWPPMALATVVLLLPPFVPPFVGVVVALLLLSTSRVRTVPVRREAIAEAVFAFGTEWVRDGSHGGGSGA